MPFLSVSELIQCYGEIEGNLMFKEFNRYFFCDSIDQLSMDILKNNFNDLNKNSVPHLSNEEECLYLEKKLQPLIQKLHLKDLDKLEFFPSYIPVSLKLNHPLTSH